jgi:photosynthetic reaction center cytochrome c subunit
MRRGLKVFLPAFLGAAFAAGIPVFAGPQTAHGLTVDQILDKYIQALGGRDAIAKLTSLTMKGSISNPSTGETGTVEFYMKAPNKRLALINIYAEGLDERGYNGAAGWFLDPDEGPKDLGGDDLTAIKTQAEFYKDLKLKEVYPQLSSHGQQSVGGKAVYVLISHRPDGSDEELYFDAESGLLVRDDAPYVTDDGRSVVENVFEDFRDVDGVKRAFTVRQTSPDFDYVIKFSEIRSNAPIEDSKFEKPQGGKP